MKTVSWVPTLYKTVVKLNNDNVLVMTFKSVFTKRLTKSAKLFPNH